MSTSFNLFDFLQFFNYTVFDDLRNFFSKYNDTFKLYNYGITNNQELFPKPIIYDNFITDEESEYIMKTAKKLFKPSMVGDSEGGLNENIRKSYTAWLSRDDEVVKKIILKACEITNMDFENVEELQVVKYYKNGFYKSHCDSYTSRKYENKNFRIFTFLIYLNDDYTGGKTNFPKINFTAQPKKNRAIFFQSLDSSKKYLNEHSLHRGLEIKHGIKYVANIWINDKPCILNPQSEKKSEKKSVKV